MEREFDRYYMRLRNSLRGTASHLVGGEQEDTNLFDYAVKQNADSWDNEEHDFEDIEANHNSLVCYISKHQEDLDVSGMFRVLGQNSSDLHPQP